MSDGSKELAKETEVMREHVLDSVSVSGSCEPGWGVYLSSEDDTVNLAWIDDDSEAGRLKAEQRADEIREVLCTIVDEAIALHPIFVSKRSEEA